MAQISERGYLVAEVAQHLGVSQHSLDARKKTFAQSARSDEKASEIRWLKRELARVTQERGITN